MPRQPRIRTERSLASRQFPVPTARQQEDFLIRLYFGTGSDYVRLCVRRAYLDLNRTLHGFMKFAGAEQLRKLAYGSVEKALAELRRAPNLADQDAFDRWHERSCESLRVLYEKGGFPGFSVGQAQKWLNMSLKYAFAIGESRLPGFSGFYSFAHVPLDNIILAALTPYGVPCLGRAWSRVDDYSAYMRVQRWIRSEFPDSPPLAVEFHLWQDPRGEAGQVTSS